MKKFLVCLTVVAALIPVGTNHSKASRPVPQTITGCVINGTLYSIHRDVSKAAGKRALTVYPMKVDDLDLAPYEGKKIRVHGNLLPADRFHADPQSIRVLGPCDKGTKKTISERRR